MDQNRIKGLWTQFANLYGLGLHTENPQALYLNNRPHLDSVKEKVEQEFGMVLSREGVDDQGGPRCLALRWEQIMRMTSPSPRESDRVG